MEYPDFKLKFKALTGDQGHKQEVLLIYLKNALPASAHYLMLGAKDVETVWKRLDDKYGNRQQRIIAIHEKLVRAEIKGRDYEKVERLHYEVELAQGMLEENQAAASPRCCPTGRCGIASSIQKISCCCTSSAAHRTVPVLPTCCVVSCWN